MHKQVSARSNSSILNRFDKSLKGLNELAGLKKFVGGPISRCNRYDTKETGLGVSDLLYPL